MARQFKQVNCFDILGVECKIPGVGYNATSQVEYGPEQAPIDVPLPPSSTFKHLTNGGVVELATHKNFVIKPESEIDWKYWITVICMLIVLAVVIYLIYREYKKSKEEEDKRNKDKL